MWSISKALHVPLDLRIAHLASVPYTISYVIRKMQQLDNLNELPKEKRPTEDIIWDGTSEDLDEWLEKVLDPKKKAQTEVEFVIKDVEGA
jgi:hypothetical protein